MVQLDLAAVEDRQTRTVILATMHQSVAVGLEQELQDIQAMPVEVRRRLARVFTTCSSQRAADGLLLTLELKKDQGLRFSVRAQCARSLAAVVERNPRIQIDPAKVSAIILREVDVSRYVWERRRLVDSTTGDGDEQSPFDEVVGVRASRALAHVFTLLGLMLPAELLHIDMAYRACTRPTRIFRGSPSITSNMFSRPTFACGSGLSSKVARDRVQCSVRRVRFCRTCFARANRYSSTWIN